MKKLPRDILIFIGGIFIWIFIVSIIGFCLNWMASPKTLPDNYMTSSNPDKSPDYPSPSQSDSYPDW